MSKAHLMAELAQLSPEDRAEVRAWLDRITPEIPRTPAAKLANATPRLRSPRLADPTKAGDFAKKVTELPANAPL